MTYFEWAGPFDQKIIVPWRLIDGPEIGRCGRQRNRARALSARLAHLDFGALQFAKPLFDASGFNGMRRVDRRVGRRRQQ